jgi:hypothetical protein
MIYLGLQYLAALSDISVIIPTAGQIAQPICGQLLPRSCFDGGFKCDCAGDIAARAACLTDDSCSFGVLWETAEATSAVLLTVGSAQLPDWQLPRGFSETLHPSRTIRKKSSN